MGTKNWLPRLTDCSPSLLRTIVAFADYGSVTGVAKALGLDQALASRRLQAFIPQRDADNGLLQRVGVRGLRLTERGRRLIPQIREVLARYDEMLDHLTGQQKPVEVVRVALGSFAAQLYLPMLLAKMQSQDHWGLESRLIRGQDRIRGVAEGRFDLALVTHAPEDIAQLSAEFQPVTSTRFARHVVAVVAHPETAIGQELAAHPPDQAVPLERLARWPLVGLDQQSGLRRKLEQQVRAGGNLRFLFDNQPGGWTLAKEYARHRLGVALLPCPLLTPEDRSCFVVRHLVRSFLVEDFLVVRKQGQSFAQRAVIRLLRHSVSDSGAASAEP